MLSFALNIDYFTMEQAAPYGGVPASIPGTIQAEEFDFGGEGVGYSDTTAENKPNGVSGNGYIMWKRLSNTRTCCVFRLTSKESPP